MTKMRDFLSFGLVGEDISHSYSPHIYNTIFDEINLNAVYFPFPVPNKEKFLSALPILRMEFAGFNATAPFRRDIMAHLDKADLSAKKAGTANTIVVKDEKLIGFNTEIDGFMRSLISFSGDLHDKDVLLVGAGGVSRAVASVLLDKGAFLTLLSRSEERAAELMEGLQKQYHKNRLKTIKGLSNDDEFYAVFNTAKVDIGSKASEISIHPHTYESFEFAYDTSYVPTEFLKKAQSFGAKTKNGLDMLFYQAVMSVNIWLGQDMDRDAIENAHRRVMEQLK
jgi:shikimate dehydrogenase